MTRCGLISQKRLKFLPKRVRLSHEYCFFLHDQCVRVLADYEREKAHHISFNFESKDQKELFEQLVKEVDLVEAIRVIGKEELARRLILNHITIAMTSDCLHHIYEALRCFEKRKFVVGFNILRKPLTDNLIYLSWMLSNQDDFYLKFSSGDPKCLASDRTGQKRSEFIEGALKKTAIHDFIDAKFVCSAIFDRKNISGLQPYFQHAVHLITTLHPEITTTPENFNFIFKSLGGDDLWPIIYSNLPSLFLYLAHVIFELFSRMREMDAGAKTAFIYRSRLGIYLAHGGPGNVRAAQDKLNQILSSAITCDSCGSHLNMTEHNAARVTLTDTFRCGNCRKIRPFPFSWVF